MKRNSTDSRKKAKMLATERRSHEPIDTLTVISRRQLGKRQGGSRVDAVELKTEGILFEFFFFFSDILNILQMTYFYFDTGLECNPGDEV